MLLRLIDQSVVNGIQREFEAVGNAKFVEDVVQMVLDRLFGDEELFPDFLVAEALRDELNNLLLAVAEQRRSEEHTSELQSHLNLVCRLLLEKKKDENVE